MFIHRLFLYICFMKSSEVIKQFRLKIMDSVEFSVPNAFFFGSQNKIESDIIAVSKCGYLTEYEIKTNRSDFLADFKKTKWETYTFYSQYAPKRFYYVLPKGIAKINELPEFAGLYEYINQDGKLIFNKVKKAVKLNDNKVSSKGVYVLMKKLYYKSLDLSYNNIKNKI